MELERALVSADRGKAGARQTTEKAAHERERQVMATITGRLSAGACRVRGVGSNCAAVEIQDAEPAEPTSTSNCGNHDYHNTA
jgi:hypothetical protein